MGGCCSKCGNYMVPASSREKAEGGENNPKLTKLQHKQSFTNNPATAGGAGGKVNGDGGGATPSGAENNRRENESQTRGAAF